MPRMFTAALNCGAVTERAINEHLGEVVSLKKFFPRAISILAGLIAGVLISGILFWATGYSIFGKPREKPLQYDDVTNASLTALAFDILENIRDGDYRELSQVVHPSYGLLFSPSSTVTLSTNKCFSAGQVAAFGTDTNVYVWGVYDGSGEPIEMTPAGYFAEFVYDRDYANATVIGVNHVVKSGNALENMAEVFPDILYVDFHFPCSDKNTADSTNWSSLRLGFEEYNGSLMLMAILHSGWTV